MKRDSITIGFHRLRARSALFGSKLTDDFIQVKVGGDLALMNAVLKRLIEWGAVNQHYIDSHTVGWSELEQQLLSLDDAGLSERSGVSLEKIEWLATLIARSNSMVTVYSMGLTQHKFGTENVCGVVNASSLTGGPGPREK